MPSATATCSHAEGGVGVTFNEITKDAAAACNSTARFVAWLGALHQTARACGCPKMIFRTHPHGHRPRLCSSVTYTPSFLPIISDNQAFQSLIIKPFDNQIRGGLLPYLDYHES
jgi:hypothetical protein